ncbi:HAD family hydrolase [Bacillus sp. JJ864]|uniref:HAD family hydrolase n=1 Tax=Bacillus sp. JJ864 TaxID=3122975 RepID=UPI002FFF5BEC
MKYIVFDLDETIFDHKRGEKESLKEIYNTDFKDLIISFGEFHRTFTKYNKISWEHFEKGIQNIEETLFNRFKLLCDFYGMKKDLTDLVSRYSHEYIKQCIPYLGANTLLKELVNMGFSLAVCSNGMEKIQIGKMNYHNIKHFFSYFQFGRNYPACKPNLEFFNNLLKNLKAKPHEVLFIGDSLTNDINPAKELGMKSLHINEKYLVGGELQCTLILDQIQNQVVLS